jgi:hypothetical protein
LKATTLQHLGGIEGFRIACYSGSVAAGAGEVATGKDAAGADSDRQDLHLSCLSEPENSGGVHRPDPRTALRAQAGSCAALLGHQSSHDDQIPLPEF